MWADNADVMSEQYTGTSALKTDFTRYFSFGCVVAVCCCCFCLVAAVVDVLCHFRTGKRSVKGSVTDGMNSVMRYINKNFHDDEKQV